MEATVVKKAFIPISVIQAFDNEMWLQFSYSSDDKLLPYKYPKVIKYQNKYFQWMSYNSDNMVVNYKEISKDKIAFAI